MKRRTFLKAFTVLPFLSLLGVRGYSQLVQVPLRTTTSTSSSVDLQLLLECISQVESGNDDTKIGKHGERSKYQISPKVWRQWFPVSYTWFERDCKGQLARHIADMHLNWLDKNLTPDYKQWINLKIYPLAVCWHAGLNHWQTASHISSELNNYAVRICNLYDERRRTQ